MSLNLLNDDTLLTIVLMAVITVVSRSFFFISDARWTLPHWAQRGLQYAPIAALSAVVIPELVMTQGVFIHTVLDARLYGAVAGADCVRHGGVFAPAHPPGLVRPEPAPCLKCVATTGLKNLLIPLFPRPHHERYSIL
jgi:branched-subunit amino acid transport protein